MGHHNIQRLLERALVEGNKFHLASGEKLKFIPVVDDQGSIEIGNGTNDMDLKIFLGASTDFVRFDIGNGNVEFDNAELKMGDSDEIALGDASDVTIAWDGTDMDILPLADDSVVKFGDGTLSFDIWFYGNTATDYVLWDASLNALTLEGGGGGSRRVGGLAYSNTAASTAVSNTTSETAFDTNYTIPANTLKAGSVIKVRFQGIAPATNATDTLAIKLYLATDLTAGAIVGTTLISMAATDVANNDVFQGEYTLIVRTIGAGGTMVGAGSYKSIPAAEGTMTIKDDILASTAVNTIVAQKVAATATWSVANAGDSCRLDVMSVEIY